MEIKRGASQPAGTGPSASFTGTVRLDPLFGPPDPARAAMALVTFEPGDRTAWHILHRAGRRSARRIVLAGRYRTPHVERTIFQAKDLPMPPFGLAS